MKINYLLIFLFFVGIFRVFYSVLRNEVLDIFWFCVINFLFLIYGVYKKNNLIISSVLVSSFISGIFYSVDILSVSFSNKMIFGVTPHLIDVSKIGLILTYYHIILLTIPFYFVLKEKKFHEKSLVFSSLLYLCLSVLSVFTGTNINGVREGYTLGIFDFVYKLKPEIIPFFIFNWILATLILFLPTYLFFNFLIRKL